MDTPCVIWAGPTTRGYGYHHGRRIHRWVMEQALGRRLLPQEVVRHLCDVPACFRYDHLALGTQLDNIADMVAKGRQRGPKGEAHGMAKLTAADVAAIRSSAEGATALARRYAVTRQLVWRIRSGRNW